MARKKKTAEWTNVKGLEGWSVIGTDERFSLSFEPFEGMLIVINGCRIIEGKNGDFISFPSWKDKEDNWHQYARVTFENDEVKKIIDAL